MLSQAFYWSSPKRNKTENQWFYKSQTEWTEETGLSRAEQETARKKLRAIGVLEEKKQGLAAKEFTDQWITKAEHWIKIETILDKNEKYGRILARVWDNNGNCLNTDIVASGLAREYYGVGDKTFTEFKKDK
jgi:hypothetical protein